MFCHGLVSTIQVISEYDFTILFYKYCIIKQKPLFQNAFLQALPRNRKTLPFFLFYIYCDFYKIML